jgi:hypothetical protein
VPDLASPILIGLDVRDPGTNELRHLRWPQARAQPEVREVLAEALAACALRDAPHPGQARCSAELVACMRRLKDWAGYSLRDLERRAGPGRLPRSTLSVALNSPHRLPSRDLLHAFVIACGASAYWPIWAQAYTRISATAR